MPTTYPYAPAATNADEDGYAAPTCADPVDITSHDQLIASAKYVFGPAFDELMGLLKGRVSSQAYRQTFTCGTGDAVGDAVELNGSATVRKASGSGKIVGRIRYKPTTTTCYLDHFWAVSSGVSGSPGEGYTINGQRIGTFVSSTVALCYASFGSDGSTFDGLDEFSQAGIYLAHANAAAGMIYNLQNFA